MNITQTITKLTELADALGRGGLSLGFTSMHGKTVLDEAELRAMASAIAKSRDELSSMRESAQSADLPQPASDGLRAKPDTTVHNLQANASRLMLLLTAAGICHQCGGEISHDVDEPFAHCPTCGENFGEWTGNLPTIQSLRLQIAAQAKPLASTQDRPAPYGYCDRCGSEVHGNTCPPCQACGGHITAV